MITDMLDGLFGGLGWLVVGLVMVVVACRCGWGGWKAIQAHQVEHERQRIENVRLRLDVELVTVQPGAIRIHRADVRALAGAQVQLLAGYTDAMRPAANVPQTIHYAPHYARLEQEHQALQAQVTVEQPAAITVEARDLWQLWTADQLPDDGFLLGHNLLTGEAVTAGWLQLYSALVGGTSGSGKSTLIRSVLVQSALQGGRFVVLDRHYGAGAESLGASLQPLRAMMPFDVAGNERAMVDALRYVLDVGRRRIAGNPDHTPLIMVVDETTALFQRSEIAGELATVLAEISQETRKVGVYAMCIGQNFSSEVMPTTARNSFASFFSCRARRDMTRVMSGNNAFAKAAEGLKIGQAAWMDTGGEVITLAVPNCTQRHVEMVARQYVPTRESTETAIRLPTPGSLTSTDTPAEVNGKSDAGLNAHAARALELFKSGHTQSEIIAEVWGVSTSGRPAQIAAEEFQSIIRDYLRRLEDQ